MTNKPVFELHKTLYSLSIQLSLNGFSFCIATNDGKIITCFSESKNNDILTEEELLNKVIETFNTKPELQASFQTIEVIYQNDLFTLVPKELFDINNKSEYLNYSVKTLVTDFITHDPITNTNIINIFIPYININNYLIDQLGEFNYQHSSKLLIENVLNNNRNTEKVFVYVSNGIFEVIITKDKELLLFNTFTYKTNEDVLYYILFCMEQLSLSPNETEVILLSLIDEDLYTLIYTYIRNVTKSNEKTDLILHKLALKI